ncbi:MAG: MATE family efflux transporter [Bacteroidales bacterium]|nr:MATE family efflux transporter [Bacteroidales bacterium]
MRYHQFVESGQTIQLSDHFGYRKLLLFTLPSIATMIFTSIYSVVDGVFVSNFVGKTPFAAVNLMMPFLFLIGVVGSMLGTGGSALVAKTLGEGDLPKANSIFSMLATACFISGVVFALIGLLFLKRIVIILGADVSMMDSCLQYGRILLFGLPFFILQSMFQVFLVTAERPQLGLVFTVASGLLNILLDYLLIVVFGMGLAGAAFATLIASALGGAAPLLFFLLPNKTKLHLIRPVFDGKALMQSVTNGMSEFFASISGSILSICYNLQLMKYIGENGVAAYGVIMYVQFIFFGVFFGYAEGSAPIVSFNYGAKNYAELKNVFQRSLKLIAVMGLVLTVLLQLTVAPLAKIFVGYDAELYALTCKAFRIYGLSYLLVGFNFYASSFFTALNNGTVSAVISTVRTLVFETSAVFILPAIFGVNGIWFSIICAEVLSLSLSMGFLYKFKAIYHYA